MSLIDFELSMLGPVLYVAVFFAFFAYLFAPLNVSGTVERGDTVFHLEKGLELEGTDGWQASSMSQGGVQHIRLATGWTRMGLYYTCLHEMNHFGFEDGRPSDYDHEEMGLIPNYYSECGFILGHPFAG